MLLLILFALAAAVFGAITTLYVLGAIWREPSKPSPPPQAVVILVEDDPPDRATEDLLCVLAQRQKKLN
jgi:hypothetical protein